MGYQVSDGIKQNQLPKWLKDAGQKYGKFKDGRVDYTNAPVAPVVMITVVCGNEILLVKRGYGLAEAEGLWSIVDGFIDENKPVAEIASQELNEELHLKIPERDIKIADSFTLKSMDEKRSYIVFPCLVELIDRPRLILNYEHTDFVWVKRDKIVKYEMLEDTPYTIDAALKLL